MLRLNTIVAGTAGLIIVMGMASAQDYSKSTTTTTSYANGDSVANTATVNHSVSQGADGMTEHTTTYKSSETYAPPPPPPPMVTTKETTTTTTTGAPAE